MHFCGKFGIFSIATLAILSPCFAFATDAVVPSKDYVDDMLAGKVDTSSLSGYETTSNKLNGTSTSGQKIGDLAAGSAAGQDQVMYPSAAAVKQYAVNAHPGVGTSNANVGKTLVVDSSGDVVLSTSNPEFVSNKLDGSSGNGIADTTTDAATKYPSAAAVKDYAQKKPASVASGKVLTYTGNDANQHVSADYVKIPYGAGAPSTSTPSAFLEIWVASN